MNKDQFGSLQLAVVNAIAETNTPHLKTAKDTPVGVDNLQQAIIWSIGTYIDGKTILADEKVTFWEKLGFAPRVIQGAQVVATGKQVLEELQDLTLEEAQQIEAAIAAEFPNQKGRAIQWFKWTARRIADLVRSQQEAQEIINA